MKRSYRKFFGIVLLLASLAAGPVLAYWGRAQAAGSYLGMVAGAAAYQNRLLYPADAGCGLLSGLWKKPARLNLKAMSRCRCAA